MNKELEQYRNCENNTARINAIIKIFIMTGVKKLFWKIYFANKNWENSGFLRFHYVVSSSKTILYAGVTFLWFSILYSDEWRTS